jgi:hypothetical protein
MVTYGIGIGHLRSIEALINCHSISKRKNLKKLFNLVQLTQNKKKSKFGFKEF